MQKKSYEIKNTQENKKLVQTINGGLLGLEKEIENMSEDETEIKRPNEIVDAAV